MAAHLITHAATETAFLEEAVFGLSFYYSSVTATAAEAVETASLADAVMTAITTTAANG